MYKGILYSFFKKGKKTVAEITSSLCHRNISRLSEDELKFCKEDLSKNDLHHSLKSMQDDKPPSNNRLTKAF